MLGVLGCLGDVGLNPLLPTSPRCTSWEKYLILLLLVVNAFHYQTPKTLDMKTLLLCISLLVFATSYGQIKKISRSTQKVNLYMMKDSDFVFLTDSSGKQIHSKLEVLRVDSTLYNGQQVILLYGMGVIISFSDIYVAYDTPTEGFVYINPKKD